MVGARYIHPPWVPFAPLRLLFTPRCPGLGAIRPYVLYPDCFGVLCLTHTGQSLAKREEGRGGYLGGGAHRHKFCCTELAVYSAFIMGSISGQAEDEPDDLFEI